MSKKRKSYCDWNNPRHCEAIEAAGEKTKKLDSAQNKVREAYEMLRLLQEADDPGAEMLSFAACIQIEKIMPLLKSALKKLDRHGIDHLELAFNHCLGGAK